MTLNPRLELKYSQVDRTIASGPTTLQNFLGHLISNQFRRKLLGYLQLVGGTFELGHMEHRVNLRPYALKDTVRAKELEEKLLVDRLATKDCT